MAVFQRLDLAIDIARLSEVVPAGLAVNNGRAAPLVTVPALRKLGRPGPPVPLAAHDDLARKLRAAVARRQWMPLWYVAFGAWIAWYAWYAALGPPVSWPMFIGLTIAMIGLVVGNAFVRSPIVYQQPIVRSGQIVIRQVHPDSADEWLRRNPFITTKRSRRFP